MLSYVATLSIMHKTQYLLYVTKLGDQIYEPNMILWIYCEVTLFYGVRLNQWMQRIWKGVGFKRLRGST